MHVYPSIPPGALDATNGQTRRREKIRFVSERQKKIKELIDPMRSTDPSTGIWQPRKIQAKTERRRRKKKQEQGFIHTIDDRERRFFLVVSILFEINESVSPNVLSNSTIPDFPSPPPPVRHRFSPFSNRGCTQLR